MKHQKLPPRFTTTLGNDGFDDPPSRLKPFAATYRFQSHIFGLCIWEHAWSYAQSYANSHNLKLEGIITDRFDD